MAKEGPQRGGALQCVYFFVRDHDKAKKFLQYGGSSELTLTVYFLTRLTFGQITKGTTKQEMLQVKSSK